MGKRQSQPHITSSISEVRRRKPEVFGIHASDTWHNDPRRLVFMLSRYKFVAKMLDGLGHVLEVGCADGFGTRIVAQAVKRVTGIDLEPAYIESARAAASPCYTTDFHVHDVLDSPFPGVYDAVFALDVLEHIEQAEERLFLSNCLAGLKPDGVCIIGMPSLESQPYASAGARMGHVNCKTQLDLKSLMQDFFHNVFLFSANDEVVHTGYSKMSHYNLALCCGSLGITGKTSKNSSQ